MSISIGLIAQTIEKIAPKSWAEEWDNVGLLVGDYGTKVERILLTLDLTPQVIEEAREKNAKLIVAHHPILFRPLKNLRSDNQSANLPIQLLKEDIAYYAAHTNLDQSHLSAARSIGEALGLEKMEIFDDKGGAKLVKLVTFVPQDSTEKVREALAKVGVGEGITDGPNSAEYSECFYEGEGTGMFRPLAGANPTIGEIGELTKVAETRLESILPEAIMGKAIRALKKAHPYEEPAYDLYPLYNQGPSRGYGVVGYLPEPLSLENCAQKLSTCLEELAPSTLNTKPNLRLAGSGKEIKKIAIVNGSGGSYVKKALFQGVDLLITGDVDHHEALDALESGLNIIDMGHFWGEVPMVKSLGEYLANEKALAGAEILISENLKSPWLDLKF
ncbi:MAG: Nif3-like dinuclear metal center hexameric protein [Desulfitobacterium sp.]|nr:Nif3-like dinuclear metal center hexameric protein [Desulfitobacterium sp.]